MDWTTPLRSLQADFIKRLESDSAILHQLNNSELRGYHSELTVVSGEELDEIRKHCWYIADKYKRTSQKTVYEDFINNLKGKLGEVVVKKYLDRLVTPIDLEQRHSGDGKVDFKLTSDPSIAIQVKARHASIDTVKWSISLEEANKNAVLVCIWIQEEVSEAQSEYNLILAGFLPTTMMKVSNGKALIGIDELLYGGGLQSYLESLSTRPHQQPIESNLDTFQHKVSIERPKLKKQQQILESRKHERGVSSPQSLASPSIKLTAPNRPMHGKQSKAATQIVDRIQICGQQVDVHPTLADDELRSERGIDYRKLRELLTAGKWNEADYETLAIMLKVCRRENESWLQVKNQVKDIGEFLEKFPCLSPGWLRVKDIKKFPCTDLSTIDQLWVTYSKGRFGFSVQKRIYDAIAYHSIIDAYEIFLGRVAWRMENPQTSFRLHRMFSLDAPEGHLPGNLDWWCGVNRGPNRFFDFLGRLSKCGIGVTKQLNDPDGIPF